MTHFPPKRILVAFDFSEHSFRAWKYARDLANRFGSQLDAVYVTSLAEKERVERALGAALEDADGIHVVEGPVAEAVIDTARATRAELIVMGTAGLTGLRRLVHPSYTEDVARRSPIPVLAVHADTRLPRSVLAPVNLEPYSLRAFGMAEKVAAAFGARVTLFNAAEDATGEAVARRDLGMIVGKRVSPVIAEIKVVGGRAVEAIIDEAPRHELIVLAAHTKGFLSEAILGTTAEQVLRRSMTPVLCVPAEPPRAQPRRARRTPAKKLHSAHASGRRSGALGGRRRGVGRRGHRRLARR